MAEPRAEAPKIITDRQARALIELMDLFYSDPKNREAFEKWKADRERKTTPVTA